MGFLGTLLGTLGAGVLGNRLTGKVQLEQEKALLEQVKIFNAASSFYKIWNTTVLSKRT